MKIKILILVVIAWLLPACAGSGSPQLIAAQKAEAPIATYPQPPSPTVIYTTTLDLQVVHVERAAGRAQDIAIQQGGYLAEAQSWYQEGEKHSMLRLAVPAHRFEAARSELLQLGALQNEWLSGTLAEPGPYPQQDYAQITVFLHPKVSPWSATALPDWHPLRTLAQAWEVFLSIFGFILDVAIWLIVVVGPFALIAWGLRRLIRQWKHPAGKGPTNQEPKPPTGA